MMKMINVKRPNEIQQLELPVSVTEEPIIEHQVECSPSIGDGSRVLFSICTLGTFKQLVDNKFH